MARIRSIKPAFFRSLSIAELPVPTRLTFVGLWTYVDDAGRGVDDPRLVKAEIWPLDDRYTVKKVEEDLVLLARKGRILRYRADGKKVLAVVNWAEHQRINRPQDSTLPPPPFTERSVNPHGASSDPSGNAHPECSEHSPPTHGSVSEPSRKERKGKEGKGDGREGKGPVVSSVGDHPRVDAEPLVTTDAQVEANLARLRDIQAGLLKAVPG